MCTTRLAVRRAFPPASLDAIVRAIAASETTHSGDIRFAVEAALESQPLWRGESARARALEVFSLLRVWDTEHNNGVLIYLLMADRDVEIVADRGIHTRVGAPAWEAICRDMEDAFKRGDFERGLVAGIEAVSKHLSVHFPAAGGAGVLPNDPILL